VPETIQALRQANVKIWMLTGDKRETAHDIAKTTFLIDHDTIKYQFFPDSDSDNTTKHEGWRVDFHRKIKAALSDVETNHTVDRSVRRRRQHSVFIGSEFVDFRARKAVRDPRSNNCSGTCLYYWVPMLLLHQIQKARALVTHLCLLLRRGGCRTRLWASRV
jgi:magnesium-transporting ATPase (P-type)